MRDSDLHEDGAFKIGAVSRLTGVSAHTLRKWESRYEAVVPGRTERGQRVYSKDDVERLSLISRLVGAGVAPRDAARLSLEELRNKAAQVAQAPPLASAGDTPALRAAIIGTSIALMFEDRVARSTLDIRLCVDCLVRLGDKTFDEDIDVVIYECDWIGGETRRQVDSLLERIGARTALIMYRFGSRGDLLSLQAPHLATLRAPNDLSTIEKAAQELVRPAIAHATADEGAAGMIRTVVDVPAPRLTRSSITAIAQTVPRIRCECPHHLAEILLGLLAFEEYSEACESRNTEDAALHNYLWRSAAQARALFEDAIEHVAAAEGIKFDE